MKRSSKELKRIARDVLNNRYNVPMGAFVTATLIPAVIEIPFSLSFDSYPTTSQIIITILAEFLILLISQVLNIGVVGLHLNMTRNKPYKIFDVFYPFKNRTDRFFLAALLMSLLTILCCLPLIISSLLYFFAENISLALPVVIVCGIISGIFVLLLSLSYSFTFYFLLDNPEMKVIAAFRESRLLMKKNRSRLLYIFLSFIGWKMLIPVSFGVAALWIQPYINQTFIIFYLDCTGELNRIPVRNYSTSPNAGRFDTKI